MISTPKQGGKGKRKFSSCRGNVLGFSSFSGSRKDNKLFLVETLSIQEAQTASLKPGRYCLTKLQIGACPIVPQVGEIRTAPVPGTVMATTFC